MTRNNDGGGFKLPAPNAGEARKRTVPLPELADGGYWELNDTPIIESNADLRNAGGGGILNVPLADDSAAAALVRAHELGHARWTPRNLPDAMIGDASVQLAEDCRMWQRLASAGVDCSPAIAPPDEWRERIAQGPPRSYLLGLAVATAGTGDGANYREALREVAAAAPEPFRPQAQAETEELLRIADAIVDRMRAAGDWPTFADTLAAADCIREVRPPEPQTEPQGGGDEGDPGDGDGDSDGSNGGGSGESSEPGESSGGESSEPGEADGDNAGGPPGDGGEDSSAGNAGGSDSPAGNASGSAPQDRPGGPIISAPAGSDPGSYRPPSPRPTPAQRGAVTRRLNEAAKQAAEAEAKARQRDRDAAAEGLSAAERAAGEQTAADIAEAMRRLGWTDEEDEGEAGELEIVRVPLPHRLPAKLRGTAYRSQSYGGRIGAAARVNTDGIVFRSRRMTKGGGTVLIDCSGSMDFTERDVDAILRAAPAVTIATYNGRSYSGELRIVATRGRRADSSDLIPPYGGNVVDVPALEWLGRQPSRPRLWVSDGIVTAAGDRVCDSVTRECERLARRYGICRVGNVSELLALADQGRTYDPRK